MAQWNDLIIDADAVPVPSSDDAFREWMTQHRFFVSSTMDDEMTPFRNAVRRWLQGWGSHAVMWEELVPRDERAAIAYLDGVRHSDVYILVAGSRYGVSDASGYSPTHQEGEQAKAVGIPRLVFDLSLLASPRDGRLVDWLRSLQAEVSTSRFADEQELLRQLEQRLREMASEQETPWLKLGPIIVPGKVSQRLNGGETAFEVRIRTRDREVQQALASLNTHRSIATVDRLTWGSESYPVSVVNVESATISTYVREFTVSLNEAADRGGGPMNIGSDRATIDQQVEVWSRAVLFNDADATQNLVAIAPWTMPDYEQLPQIVERYGVRGWAAEGLARLYFVESMGSSFEGSIERLDVGPATSFAVRVSAEFQASTHEAPLACIHGLVPLA